MAACNLDEASAGNVRVPSQRRVGLRPQSGSQPMSKQASKKGICVARGCSTFRGSAGCAKSSSLMAHGSVMACNSFKGNCADTAVGPPCNSASALGDSGAKPRWARTRALLAGLGGQDELHEPLMPAGHTEPAARVRKLPMTLAASTEEPLKTCVPFNNSH